MLSRIAFSAALLVVLCGVAAAQELGAPGVQGFEDSIRSGLNTGEYRDVFAAISAYESHLVARYSPATFVNGAYRSEAAHLSFTSPYTGWEAMDTKSLPSMGPAVQVLLGVAPGGDQNAEDHLYVLRFRLKQVLDRYGASYSEALPTGESTLQFTSRLLAGMLGYVQKTGEETIGSRNVEVNDISTGAGGAQACLMVFENMGDVYAVLLQSGVERYGGNKSKLRSLIESARFDVRPPDTAKTSAITGASYPGSALDAALARARDLAEAGEYDAAVAQLDAARDAIVKQMPEPRIEGSTYVNEPYNIRLTNTDAGLAWQFVDLGGQKMAVLAPEGSTQTTGLGLLIMDIDLLYGAQFSDFTLAQGPREFLSSAGRGGAQAIGRVMGEKFVKVGGHTAYQAEVDPNAPGVAINVVVIDHGRTPLMALMVLDSRSYDEDLAKYMAILERTDFDYKPRRPASP